MHQRLELILSALVAWVRQMSGSYRGHYLGALENRSTPIKSVLVVCRGNICRSPYAAVKLRQMLGSSGPEVRSGGLDTTPGKPADPTALTAARARGVELKEHCTASATKSELDAADLIVAMDESHLRGVAAHGAALLEKTILLGALEPTLTEGAIIPDPYGRPEAIFDACYLRIDRCLEKLVRELSRRP